MSIVSARVLLGAVRGDEPEAQFSAVRLSTTATDVHPRETAGGSNSAPSEPFQISTGWPFWERHSPSPVPRDG